MDMSMQAVYFYIKSYLHTSEIMSYHIKIILYTGDYDGF